MDDTMRYTAEDYEAVPDLYYDIVLLYTLDRLYAEIDDFIVKEDSDVYLPSLINYVVDSAVHEIILYLQGVLKSEKDELKQRLRQDLSDELFNFYGGNRAD